MKKVLILSHDKVGDKMAGPGIRYHYLAEILAEEFEVTLGAYNPKYLDDHNHKHKYKTLSVPINDFRAAFDEHDYIIALWLSNEMLEYANAQRKMIIFDIYAPVPVEIMAQMLFAHTAPGDLEDQEFAATIRRYMNYLRYGDLFLVSNERQLDFWVGFGFGTGQVTPLSFEELDPYRRLAVAPMGIDTKQPLKHSKNVLRGVVGEIKQDDLVLIWTGGLWDWFDAQTVVRAMEKLKDHADIKLVFLGTQHPNSEVPAMAETRLTRELSAELGLTDKTVYFFDGWLDYHARVDYFMEADAAIYAHKPSIEARYSHRTRVLDHVLMKLPTIATAGDYFADEVEAKQIGLVTPPGDPDAMAEAILKLRDKQLRREFQENIDRVRDEYDWHNVLAPVVKFIRESDPSAKTPVPTPEDQPLIRPLLYRLAQRYIPFKIRRFLLRVLHRVRRMARA